MKPITCVLGILAVTPLSLTFDTPRGPLGLGPPGVSYTPFHSQKKGFALDLSSVGNDSNYTQWNYLNDRVRKPSPAQFILDNATIAGSMDIPHVFPRPNDTSSNWWYFDAYNPDNLNESVVVVAYLATAESFLLNASVMSSVSAEIFLSFADGSGVSVHSDAKPKQNDQDYGAIVATDGSLGASGNWSTTGVSFCGYSDGRRVDVTIDGSQYGIEGTINIKTDIYSPPAAYPCSIFKTTKEGESMEAGYHIGWANLIPDGYATVNLTYKSKEGVNRSLNFQGIGYHDTKWADQPLPTSIKDYYSGHLRWGEFYIVFFSTVQRRGNVAWSNAYMYHPWLEWYIGCATEAPDPSYMLQVDSSDDTKLKLQFTFHKALDINITITKHVVAQDGPITRYTGSVWGVTSQGVELNGTSFHEEWHFE